MKEIKVDGLLMSFQGKPLKDPEGKDSSLTIKDALLGSLGSMKAKDGIEAMRILALGTDLAKAETTFRYDNQDDELLRKAIDTNSANWSVLVVGAMYKLVNEAVKVDLNVLKGGKEDGK